MRDRIAFKVMLAVLTLLTLVTACSNATATPPPAKPVELVGTEWVVTSINGAVPLQDTRITLAFTGEGVSGFAGCNNYGGTYETASTGLLAIAEMAITAQGCLTPEGVLQQENVYVEALTNAVAYHLEENRLEIANAEGAVTLVFVQKEHLSMAPSDLVDSRWRLLSMAGASPLEGAPITLVFHSESEMSGQAGCRGYVAAYEAEGDGIGLFFLGMTGAADSCSDVSLSQEGVYTTHLEQATDYRLAGGKLEILTAPGVALVFEPLPEDADTSLKDTTWTLTAFVAAHTAEGTGETFLLPTDLLTGTDITATFEDGRLHGSAGCNSYGGGFALSGSNITFENLFATEMACLDPAGAMDQEQRYLAMLSAVTTYRIDGSQLWLAGDDGQALVYTAQEDG